MQAIPQVSTFRTQVSENPVDCGITNATAVQSAMPRVVCASAIDNNQRELILFLASQHVLDATATTHNIGEGAHPLDKDASFIRTQ
jgi:hypothetical protein